MRTIHSFTAVLAASLAVAPVITTGQSSKVDPRPGGRNRVQIALLLDTSNSMDGLIRQAKTQLWKVVNSLIDARRDGEAPFVEVALYEYGNNGLPAGSQYVRMVQPLTRDLDEVSKQLFALTTDGGEEYCGVVIQRALTDLQWEDDPMTYKAMFIAGNEPFTQGPVDARSVSKEAFAGNVIVNTIHCGAREDGVRGDWHDGAAMGGGEYMVIAQDKAVTHIDAPQDARIEELGKRLNQTYIAYGEFAREGKLKQDAADRDAAANSSAGSAVQRSIAKSSVNYSNSSCDLVDAVRDGTVDVEALPSESLPKGFQDLTTEELRRKVDTATRERAVIQREIRKLRGERSLFVEKQRGKLARNGEKTLDEVLIQPTRRQAEKLGYTFGE